MGIGKSEHTEVVGFEELFEFVSFRERFNQVIGIIDLRGLFLLGELEKREKMLVKGEWAVGARGIMVEHRFIRFLIVFDVLMRFNCFS
jgi:hypothetical protein